MNVYLALAFGGFVAASSGLATVLSVPPAVAAAAPAADAGTKEQAPDPTLKTLQGRVLAPEKVTAGVRQALKRKMRNHAKDFTGLPLHVVLADYASVERSALGIMNEPRIDKASAGDDLSGLSDFFFQLQDQLRERAGAVNKAAKDKDVSAMTTAVSGLMETCATCHVIYREPMMAKDAQKK